MAVEIIMPKLGMSMEEGTVVEWLKKKGDQVKKGESVAVISSDKIEKDIEAPQDGILIKVAAEADETIAVGEPIGYIGEAGEKAETTLQNTNTQSAKKETAATLEKIELKERPPVNIQMKVRISPAARKLAKAEGIDIQSVKGTGPQGRVTKEDIEAVIKQKSASVKVERKQMKATKPTGTTKPLAGMRKVISERMHASLQNSAQLTLHLKANVTELLHLRKKINDNDREIKLSVTDLIARATILALLQHKHINCTLENNTIHTYETVQLGMAVALENGLVVPVIREAEKLSLNRLSEQIKDLSTKAREGTLESDQMKGSTFTITSLGASGIEYFTPILNPPEAGILGVGSAVDTPVFVGENLERQTMLPLSLTFDHRVIDGAPASEFLNTVKDYLENPYQLLIR